MTDFNIEKIYAKAISYCLSLSIKKRYTVFGMKEKLLNYLKKISISEEQMLEVQNRVIPRLIELNYLNDRDYASDFFNEKSRLKGKGKFKIIAELKKKRIPNEIISETVENSEINEGEIINNLLNKSSKKWSSDPINKQKEKAYRFLASRGFSSESIYNCLNNHYSNTNDKDY